MSRRLHGRTAVVIGGGRGIGEAIAVAFAAEGARLCIASRTLSELETVASRCRGLGAECMVSVCDIAIMEEVERLIEGALEHLGKIDVLVNVAGVQGPIGLLTQISLAEWREALEVNLLGTVYACYYVLPSMMARRNGSIINFSGGGATSPRPLFSAYGVSKAAVVRLTETLASEVADYGIRVNAIAPGAVDTRLQDEVLAAGNRAGDSYTRIRALKESGEGWIPAALPAGLAVFLASDDSLRLTGRLISAPHDSWREWTPDRLAALTRTPWYTLRRIDPFTIASIKDSAP